MSLAPVPDPPPQHLPRIRTRLEVKAEARPPFRVPGLIHSALTGIVGEPYAGKSGLASHLIASGLLGTPFLDVGWDTAPDQVVLVSTDPGSDHEYNGRFDQLGLEDSEPRLSFVDPPAGSLGWGAMRDHLALTPASLVVVDNVTGFVPDINSTKDVYGFFDPIERELCAFGVAVVVIAHKSEKSGPHGKSRTPMGSTAISAKFRHVVYVDRIAGGQRLRLSTDGNECEARQTVLLDRGVHAAAFTVAEAGPTATRSRELDRARLDRNADMAAWVLTECQGRNKTETAAALSAKFGGQPSGHAKNLQPGRPLGHLLDFDAVGLRWARKE